MSSIAIAIALSSTGAGTPTDWLQRLLASPLTKRVEAYVKAKANEHAVALPSAPLSDERFGTPAGNASSVVVTVGHNPTPDDPADLARYDLRNRVLTSTQALAGAGKYEDAYRSLRAFRGQRPDIVGTELVMADYANLTGGYEEAFKLLLPFVTPHATKTRIGPRQMPAISLAGAGLGHVYPGQADFCREQITKGASEHSMAGEMDRELVGRSDPKSVAALSALALGVRFVEPAYLELALHLAPLNVTAARILVGRYGVKQRPSDARRIANAILKGLRAGDPRRAEFERALGWRIGAGAPSRTPFAAPGCGPSYDMAQ